jgi:hypothetical protein
LTAARLLAIISPVEGTAESLKADVVRLARDEGRVPGTAGHERAREYLVGRMEALGLEPWSGGSLDLPYAADGFRGHNLVGVVPGRERSLAPLLVGAHYDSVIAAPCADDNAAAVAIALAAAAGVRRAAMRRDLVLALFDAEEPPFTQTDRMGSVRFYGEQRGGRPIHCAVIQDLTGHDVALPPALAARAGASRLASVLFVTGAESHAALPALLGRCHEPEELPLVATLNRNVGDVSDHGAFRRGGVPYLFLSCGHWEHYHRPSDTPDRLNYDKMKKVARLIACLASGLDGTALPPSAGEHDTTAFESELLRVSLGPLLGPLLGLLGLAGASTREHLDRFAARLQEAGI